MNIEKFTMKTPDGIHANVEVLKRLFPEIVSEGKVDFEQLKTILGGEIADDERYQFTWAGKREAMLEASTPTTKTLRPCVEESKDWENTKNLYIEGDNLEALKILQNTYGGKVKMIYIDPPYNTGHDFIYHDNFHGTKEVELIKQGFDDEETGMRFKMNPESNGRYHSDWCSMMYPRLKLARNLLRDDGVIFMSIDDNEVINARKLCDEVFGEGNFVAQVVWKNKFGSGALTSGFIGVHEYVIVYSKTVLENITRSLTDSEREGYNKTRDSKFDLRGGYVTQPLAVTTFAERPNLRYPINYKGKEIWPKKQWVWEKGRMLAAIENDEVVFNLQKDGSYNLRSKKYLIDENGKERRGKPITLYTEVYTQNGTEDIRELFKTLIFDYTKPVEMLKYFVGLEINDKEGNEDIILDFFSGSATTAHAVMKLNAEDGGNRKFVMVQLPEVCAEGSEAAKAGYKNICEIGKERIRRAGEKIKEENATTAPNLDIGFRVFKVDSSNMDDIYFQPMNVQQQDLIRAINNVKTDRTALDLLFGCLLEWGLPIDLPVKERKDLGSNTFEVDNGRIIAAFDSNITESTVRSIANEQPDFAIFRDQCFYDSASKINVSEIFKTLSPNTKLKVL